MPRNKKSLRYSYNCKDASNAKFFNKNFNKTESYNSNFTGVLFRNTSLIGAKFKFCNLNEVIFENCLVQGALFRKCPMNNVKFVNCIITATKFDRTSLKHTFFDSSVIIDAPKIKNLPQDRFSSCDVLDNYYPDTEFSASILEKFEALRNNPFINRSSVLHRKKGKLNTVAIKILLKEFSEDELLNKLPKLEKEISTDFYTLSYITLMLKRISCDANVA